MSEGVGDRMVSQGVALLPSHLVLRAPLASRLLFTASSVLLQTAPGPWNPAPASISPSLQLPTPAIVFIAVGIYLLLLGLVLLTRHCLLVRILVRGRGAW